MSKGAKSIHRYIMCPFYIDDRRKSISCEDVCRRFSSYDEKNEWIGMYCDTEQWMECPYAVDLNEAYYRREKGDEKALDKNKIQSMKREIRSLSTKLGTAEKKLEQCEREAERLKSMNMEYFGRWKAATEELDDYMKHESDRYFQMAGLYEDRLAFLIDTYCDGSLPEADVKAWAEGKEYAISFDEKATEPIWIVKIREETEDNGKDERGRISADAEGSGPEAEE